MGAPGVTVGMDVCLLVGEPVGLPVRVVEVGAAAVGLIVGLFGMATGLVVGTAGPLGGRATQYG